MKSVHTNLHQYTIYYTTTMHQSPTMSPFINQVINIHWKLHSFKIILQCDILDMYPKTYYDLPKSQNKYM